MPECGKEIFQATDIVACISMWFPSSAPGYFTQPPENNQAVRAQRNGGHNSVLRYYTVSR